MLTFVFPYDSLSWGSLTMEKGLMKKAQICLTWLRDDTGRKPRRTLCSLFLQGLTLPQPNSWPFTKARVVSLPLAWCYDRWWHFEIYTLLFLFLLRSLNVCYFPAFGCFLLLSLLALRSATQIDYRSGMFVMIRPRNWAMSRQGRYF